MRYACSPPPTPRHAPRWLKIVAHRVRTADEFRWQPVHPVSIPNMDRSAYMDAPHSCTCRSAAPSALGDPDRDGFGSARRSILGMDSAVLSPLADPCITVGAAEEVHPLPTANAHRDGRRPPSRPPYGRRLAAHRAPPSKIEAHHAAAGMHRPRPYFSGRFRSGSDLREIQISLESGAHTISFEMLRPTSCASSERLGASPHPAPKPIS